MNTYIVLVKVSREMGKNLRSLEDMHKQVGIKKACPDLKITRHLALLGPWDFLDLVDAPSAESVYKMSSVIRASGMASAVEVWPAIRFGPDLLKMLKAL